MAEGADVRTEDARGWSCLTWAAFHGNFDVASDSLKRGAGNPYMVGSSRMKHTPLHWACFKGNERVVWLLLNAGLSPETVDKLGNTCLHQAAAGDSYSTIVTLLGFGVDVFACNDRRHSPLLLCSSNDCATLINRSMNAKICQATGKQFSGEERKFLCSVTMNFFCKSSIEMRLRRATAISQEPEKPVTCCLSIWEEIDRFENLIKNSMRESIFEGVALGIKEAKRLPIDPQLLQHAEFFVDKYTAEQALKEATTPEPLENLDSYFMKNLKITEKYKYAVSKGANAEVLADAEKIQSAYNLQKKIHALFLDPPKSTVKLLSNLQFFLGLASEKFPGLIDESILFKSRAEVERLVALGDVSLKISAISTSLGVGSQELNSLRGVKCDGERFLFSKEDLIVSEISNYKILVEGWKVAGVSEDEFLECKNQIDKLSKLLEERKLIDQEARDKAAAKKAKKDSKKK